MPRKSVPLVYLALSPRQAASALGISYPRVSGKFSGNTAKVLADWDAIKVSEDNFRQLVEEDAHARAPKPSGQSWWEILEVGPSADDTVVRDAYLAKSKQCHPDRVSGLAPDIIRVAETLTKRLNEAYEESKRRPSHWKVHSAEAGGAP
jgi:hypothetical protein